MVRVLGLGFRVLMWVWEFKSGFGVVGLRVRVWGLGSRVWAGVFRGCETIPISVANA